MKFKLTVLLATFVVTMGLLLGTSAVQAAEVILDGDGNVTRIENLPVIDENTGDVTIYNVDFVYDTATNVYGASLEDFDFPDDETIFVALNAVIDALNFNDPTPVGAGPEGSDDFFIGNKEEAGLVVAVGGENLAGVWDLCVTQCINLGELQTGVTVLAPNELHTYADFTVAQDVAPGKATLISPSGTITENTPTYTWNAVENSTWYYLWVNDSTGDNKIKKWYTADQAGCGDGTGECSVTNTTVLADGSFRWWIQTWNEFGTGPWSDALSFAVDTGTGVLPGKATLISPSGTITDNNPAYTWNAVENATWYRLWVEDIAGNKKKKWYTADDADCGDGTGECSVTPAFMLADDSYDWWIQTWNDAVCDECQGPWSDSLSFTVDTGTGGTLPGKATLISPSGTIDVNTPTYTWNAVENSTWYYLWVNDSTGDEKILKWYTADKANCGDGTGECSVTPSTEIAEGSARWWIQTWNEFGTGPWSAGMSFTVNTGTVDPGVNVILDDDGNVTRIENLPVIDENTEETTIYNVDFVHDTAINVYGSNFVFDFPDDETIFLALNAVNDALNLNDPTPPGAGPEGSDLFFIGNKEEDGLVVAVGGENLAGVWDLCVTGCIDVGEIQTGVTVLAPNDLYTYADFTVAQ